MRILLIEDDPGICDAIRFVLTQEGYDVDICQDGEEAFLWLKQQSHDLVLLDRSLPNGDGMALLKEARAKGDATPFIMLTVYGALDDVVDGLDAGADDYLIKPFETKELLARIRACFRRPKVWWPDNIVKYKELKLHVKGRLLEWGESYCELTQRETTLFEILLKGNGAVILRENLFSYVWGADADVDPGILDHYISHARVHLKEIGCPIEIRTKRGIGYCLRG